MKIKAWVFAFSALLGGGALAQDLPRPAPVPGGVAILALAPATEPLPRAEFNGERLMVVRHNGLWKAVIGLPLSIEPGEHRVTSAGGTDQAREYSCTVLAKTYETQYIKLKQKRMVEPPPEDLRRIVRDIENIQRAFSTWTENEAPPLSLDLPAQGRLTSRFGLRRFFNNKPRQPHSGLDIAAPLGTPVTAPAAGTIVETGDYFFNGKTIFIDHGQGLISMYNHLSRIDVQTGQAVGRGEKIGEIGATGRVTGPHLHWSVSLNNNRIDPLLFLNESMLTPPRQSAESHAGSTR